MNVQYNMALLIWFTLVLTSCVGMDLDTQEGRLISDVNILLEEKLLDGEVATWSDWQVPNTVRKLAVFLTCSEKGKLCRYYYTELIENGQKKPRVFGKTCRNHANSWDSVSWHRSQNQYLHELIGSRYADIQALGESAPSPFFVPRQNSNIITGERSSQSPKSSIPAKLLRRAKQAESEYNLPFRKMINNESGKQHINPNLIHAVVYQESYYKPDAISHAGAVGLMQLMPGTARELRVDPYNPYENIGGGVRYLNQQLKKPGINGNIPLALAAYNAGYGNVRKYGYKVPPYKETKKYIERVMGLYRSK